MKRRKAPKQNPLEVRLLAFAKKLEEITKANQAVINNLNNYIERK
jgi:hypothetical protein